MKDIYQFYYKTSLKEYSINIFRKNRRNCFVFKYENKNPLNIENNSIRIGGFFTPIIKL